MTPTTALNRWCGAAAARAALLSACALQLKPADSAAAAHRVRARQRRQRRDVADHRLALRVNGWPRERLHAVDMPYPLARDDDSKPSPAAVTAEQCSSCRPRSTRCSRPPAPKVVLMGNSRGGNAIRNYIANGGGAAKVSHAILGGTPNHGVWANKFPPEQRVQRRRPVPDRLNNQGGPAATKSRRLEVDDDPLRQQRQVRPARWRVDRHQGHAHERAFAGPN